jgi:nitrite reductase/ring-hydroxylating ferredoxin subunit
MRRVFRAAMSTVPVTYRPPASLPPATGAPATSAPGFVAVSAVDAVPVGLSSYMAFPAGPLVIARTSSNSFYALHLYCAHKQAELSLGDLEDIVSPSACGAKAPGVSIRCPRHRKKFPGGLLFDASTGAAWCADVPSEKDWDARWGCAGDVPAFSTKIEGGWLFVSATPSAGRLPESAAGGGATGGCAVDA